LKTVIVPMMVAMIGLPTAAFGADEAVSTADSAREAVAEMDEAEAVVGSLLDAAQASNDAIKVSCLGDKATQISGYAAGARKALTRANFVDGTEADATLQGILADAATVQKLRAEANSCVGVDEVAAAEAAVRRRAGRSGVDAMNLGTATESAEQDGVPVVRSPAPASPTN
jgi:hypothetical protein